MSPPKLIESLLTCGSNSDSWFRNRLRPSAYSVLCFDQYIAERDSQAASAYIRQKVVASMTLEAFQGNLWSRSEISRSLFPSRLCCTSKQLTGIITDPGHCYRCLASNWTVDTGPIQHGLMIRLTLNDIVNCRYRSELSRHTLLTAQEQDVQA